MKPRRGALARCSLGMLGLITDDDMREFTYPDGNKGTAYVGVCLAVPAGSPWSSRNPTVLGYVDERVVAAIVAHVAEEVM